MKPISLILFFGGLIASLSACQEVVPVEVTPAEPQLVIEAFVTNRDTVQTIRLTQTVAYFQNGQAPAVTGATVRLKNQATGREFIFSDTQVNGIYAWTPAGADSIGRVGDSFSLSVQHQDDVYQAESRLHPTVELDSIKVEKRAGAATGNKAGYYAQFYAQDLPGQPDYYWIRSYKNGRLQNQLLSYATNALSGNDNENGSDGLTFTSWVRESITDDEEPFGAGDRMRVEVWSITGQTLDFFTQAQAQMSNEGLFARPPENVKTNFVNTTHASRKAVGWFCTSAVARMETGVEGD